MNKPIERRGKVLFIEAKKLVTRKNSESNLEDEHIERITNCYREYADIEGFSAVVTNEEILKNGGSLGVSKYVRSGEIINSDTQAIDETLGEWMAEQAVLHEEYNALLELLADGRNETNG